MRYRILAALVVGLVGALAVPVAASAHGGRSGDLSGSRGSGITSGPNGEAQTCGTGIASGDCHDILTDQGLQIGSSNGQVAGGFGITKHGMGVDGSVLGHDVSFGFPGLSSDMFGLGGSDGSKGPDSSIGLPQTGSCPMDTEVGKDIVGSAVQLTELSPSDLKDLATINGDAIGADGASADGARGHDGGRGQDGGDRVSGSPFDIGQLGSKFGAGGITDQLSGIVN